MMRTWLAQPHVRAWWGDPDDQIRLIDADMGTAPVDMRIVWFEDRPFAYIQDYPAHHWPMPHYAAFPAGTRAVDTFLGDPAMLGRGHGAGYLRQRAAKLRRRYRAVVVDPDVTNDRAIVAYRSAGFHGETTALNEDGEDVLILEFTGVEPGGEPR